MQIDPAQLLRQLASGVLPAGLTPPALTAPAGAVEHLSFADLLRQARDGTISPGVPITVDSYAAVHLTDDQLARISLAADKAEAAGLRTAMVILNDQRVILDVHERRITATADSQDGIIGGVDGVIDLRGPDGVGQPGGAGGAPAFGFSAKGFAGGAAAQNPQLLKLLANLEARA